MTNLELMKILVTGGAGYIGSHVVRLLETRNVEVLVIDDLSSGKGSRINSQLHDFALEDSEAPAKLQQIFSSHKPDAVIHLAARKQVGESVEHPEKYYLSNIAGMANLLQAMKNNNIHKMVFSSSAAAYGVPEIARVTEQTPPRPINPYGETKLIGEWMVKNARIWGLKAISLRYFNVAGAGWDDLADSATLNLIPIVFDRIEKGVNPVVFGDTYPTEDGSCIRDYVHVLDLAEAHLSALDYLEQNPTETIFNVGTGVGSSVFEVLAQIKQIAGVKFEVEVREARAGDPAQLVADASLIQKTLGWSAKYDLNSIIESAWRARGR